MSGPNGACSFQCVPKLARSVPEAHDKDVVTCAFRDFYRPHEGRGRGMLITR